MKNALDFMAKIEKANEVKEMLGEIKYSVSVRNCDNEEIGRVSDSDEFFVLIRNCFSQHSALYILTTEPMPTTTRREFKITYITEDDIRTNIRLIVE